MPFTFDASPGASDASLSSTGASNLAAASTSTAGRGATKPSQSDQHFNTAPVPFPFEVSQQEAKRQLVNFYERSFPEKLYRVDEVMKEFEGKEHEIIKKIRDHDRKKAAKDCEEKKKMPQGGDAG